MLYSSDSSYLIRKFGVENAVKMIFDAGFPAIDMGFEGDYSFALGPAAKATAKRLRAEAPCFLYNFPTEFIPAALKFMNDTAKMYADKVDGYRKGE